MTATEPDNRSSPIRVELPSDDRARTLEGYGTGASDPEAFLDKVNAEYPQIAALLSARTLEETRAHVAALDPGSYTPTIAFLITAGFQLGKLGRVEGELAAARARVEIMRKVDPGCVSSCFENTQPRNLGDALGDLGNCLARQGQVDLALKTLQEAERCYEDDAELRARHGLTRPSRADAVFGWRDFRSQLYAGISRLHADMGNAAAAERYNALAWQHSKREATPEDRFEAAMANGRGAEEAGDLETALRAFNTALDLSFTLQAATLTSKDVVEALQAIAAVHARLGLHRTAVKRLRRCIELNTEMAHRGRLLTDHQALAPSLEALGHFSGAQEALDAALRLCAVEMDADDEHAGPFVWREGEKRYLLARYRSAWRVLRQRARFAKDRGDRDAAIADLERAVAVVERLRERVLSDELRIGAQEEMMAVFDDLIALYADEFAATGDQAVAARAFLTIEHAKSRVLAEMLSDQELSAPPGVPSDLLAEEARLMAEAASLEAAVEKGEGDPLTNADQLDDVLAALNATWDRIAEAVPQGGPEYVSLRRADPVSVAEIAALLRETDSRVCLVSYFVLPDRLLILSLDPESEAISIITQPIPRETLRSWVAVNPDSPPPPDLRLQYWSLDFGPLLVEPLGALVPPGSGICFVPHDVLHSLPLHALEPAPDAAPLVETTAVSYSASASVLRFILHRPETASRECLVLGCPDRPDAAPIDHTRAEAESVANVLGCAPHTGADASHALAIARMPEARIVHIACHHRFDAAAPMQSALLLSGGDLTAQQILEMRLQSELVTLSACQSGVSELRPGDELIGTVRALLYSGARSVIVSLWNAYDEATARFMQDFYSEFVRSEGDKREMLRLAAQRVRASGLSTARWAPFVLFGNWR